MCVSYVNAARGRECLLYARSAIFYNPVGACILMTEPKTRWGRNRFSYTSFLFPSHPAPTPGEAAHCSEGKKPADCRVAGGPVRLAGAACLVAGVPVRLSRTDCRLTGVSVRLAGTGPRTVRHLGVASRRSQRSERGSLNGAPAAEPRGFQTQAVKCGPSPKAKKLKKVRTEY